MADENKKIVSRREFARGALLAVASAAVLGRPGVAQSEGTKTGSSSAAPRKGADVTKRESASPPPKPLSPDDRAEVEARMSAILRRHGGRLSNEQKDDIHRLLGEAQPSLAAFRAFPLQNSDEPATVLRVIVEKGSGHA